MFLSSNYPIINIFLAVREDRMPGGRNSGAVYNMYPCKVGLQVIRK